MGTEYTIPNLFLEAFGLKISDAYNIGVGDNSKDLSGLYKGVNIVDDINDIKEISSFGTPIISPIRFLAGAYKRYNKSGEIETLQMQDFRLPITAITDFKSAKIVGTTKINSGRGTVKEIYGFDDWQITINGFLIPDDSQPQGLKTVLEQEKELTKWDNLACSIAVQNDLFLLRNVFNITITEMSFAPMRGRPNIRSFTINAISDEPIELNIRMKV